MARDNLEDSLVELDSEYSTDISLTEAPWSVPQTELVAEQRADGSLQGLFDQVV